MMSQGWSDVALIQLDDREEHARLRSHFNAFFTQENVNAVYTTLRDAVDARIGAVAAGASSVVCVDAYDFAFLLLNEVVMKVRVQLCLLVSRFTCKWSVCLFCLVRNTYICAHEKRRDEGYSII